MSKQLYIERQGMAYKISVPSFAICLCFNHLLYNTQQHADNHAINEFSARIQIFVASLFTNNEMRLYAHLCNILQYYFKHIQNLYITWKNLM